MYLALQADGFGEGDTEVERGSVACNTGGRVRGRGCRGGERGCRLHFRRTVWGTAMQRRREGVSMAVESGESVDGYADDGRGSIA